MSFDTSTMHWIREPKHWHADDQRVEIITEPHTDLWQRTYYHFRNDNAPVLQCDTDERFFSFSAKTDFADSDHRFDQCGIVVYLDADNWIKASVEYENAQMRNLGSVVTNHGYSDWAIMPISSDVHSMWYRLSRREGDYRIEYSFDGDVFYAMRICHLLEGNGPIRFGIYACSPEDSSFKAMFSNFDLGPCVWSAHDGQPPDED